MRVLLVTPPMIQVNAPYPATAFLTGFLRSQGVETHQADLAIELISALFSAQGLRRVLADLAARKAATPAWFATQSDRYEVTMDPAIRFLQGRDPTLALRIASREFLPEGPRFQALDETGGDADETLLWAFGALGTQDKAKYLATLFLEDVADMVGSCVSPHFALARYGESLAASAPSFDPLLAALDEPLTLTDRMLDELTAALCERVRPDLVGVTAPFPGNVYGAFRIARAVRQVLPECKISLGGGYVNTELRELADPRVFDFFDHVCIDSGELPMLRLCEHLEGKRPATGLCRTMVRDAGGVHLVDDPKAEPLPHDRTGTPTYDGLPMDRYLSVFELLNPMHRIWSDGRWNKLMVAHGCYWSQCSFCDTSLDYIGRYSTASADLLVDRMESLIRETGQSGFQFVDEAAPPAALRKLSERLIARNVTATWWGNIRFDTYFSPEVCQLMAKAGCVAVTGGLEAAEDRLLKLMRKGVTVAQAARVTRNFAEAGIMVHAYLMYGFPTQTERETVDALEIVRQLFEAGCIQSAYWHRFALTVHSPVFRELFAGAAGPGFQSLDKNTVRISNDWKGPFARNEVPFAEASGVDHARLGEGLRKALYNFMHGVGLDQDVRTWFEGRAPKSSVPRHFVRKALGLEETVSRERRRP